MCGITLHLVALVKTPLPHVNTVRSGQAEQTYLSPHVDHAHEALDEEEEVDATDDTGARPYIGV